MKTVTSVSGGKTSSYMAIHYPTDAYVFAPVLTNDRACIIQDPSLRSYCQQKVCWFDWSAGGCREVDLTLHNLRKLEQELGQEINWVAAPFTYDQLIAGDIDSAIARAYGARATVSAMLPNSRLRFCTESLKVYAIAWWCYLNGNGDPWITNIGFRADEPHRLKNWCDKTKMALHCDIEGRFKGKHRHTMLEYRWSRFPLHQDGIDHFHVRKFWSEKGWEFPSVSNCDFCFFHKKHEMEQQFKKYPERAQWWIDQEKKAGANFAGKYSMEQLLSDRQLSLLEPDTEHGSCFCTD